MVDYVPIIILAVGAYALWSSLGSRKVQRTTSKRESTESIESESGDTWATLWAALKKQIPDTSAFNILSGHRTKLIALLFVLLAINNHVEIVNPRIVNTLLIAGVGLGLYFLRAALENIEKRLVALLQKYQEAHHVETSEKVVSKKQSSSKTK